MACERNSLTKSKSVQVLIAKRLLIPNHVIKSEPAQIDYTEKETRTFREGGGDSRPMAAISTHG
jgi:hypothetical protein